MITAKKSSSQILQIMAFATHSIKIKTIQKLFLKQVLNNWKASPIVHHKFYSRLLDITSTQTTLLYFFQDRVMV